MEHMFYGIHLMEGAMELRMRRHNTESRKNLSSTLWVKKGCHPNHGYNFVNSWSICKILSLLQRAVNFQQNKY